MVKILNMYKRKCLGLFLIVAMKVLECSVSKAQEALEGVIQDIPEPSWTSNLNDEGELPCLDGVEGCDEGETKVKFAEVEQGQKDNSCNSTEDDCNEANDQAFSESQHQAMPTLESMGKVPSAAQLEKASDGDKDLANGVAEAQQAQPLLCYDVQCNGEGCVYEAIIQAGTSITTCTASEGQVCYVEERQTAAGMSLTAGCGAPCDTSTQTQEGSTTAESTTTSRTEITTWLGWPFPRKRRKRSLTGTDMTRRDCCSQAYCNHDSPCEMLTCAADIPSFAKTLGILALGIFTIIFQI